LTTNSNSKATRIIKKPTEISRFIRLHSVYARPEFDFEQEEELNTSFAGAVRGRCVSIVGVTFLEGYKSRAVSVGADGRCRIVDFDMGGKVLRTWHAKAPITSLSVLPMKSTKKCKDDAQELGRKAAPRTNTAFRDPPEHVITIGRRDGKILFFNSLGLLLREDLIDKSGKSIIQLEWLPGRNVKPVSRNEMDLDNIVEAPKLDSVRKRKVKPSAHQLDDDTTSKIDMHQIQISGSHGAGNTPTIPYPEDTPSDDAEDQVDEDQLLSGTVNYVPVEGIVQRELPQINQTNYMDLFSPVKAPQLPTNLSPQRRPTKRIRPRLRSSTFVDKEGPQEFGISIASMVDERNELDATAIVHGDEAWSGATEPRPLSPKFDTTDLPHREGIGEAKPTSAAAVFKFPLRQTPKSRKTRRISFKRVVGSYTSSSTSRSNNSYNDESSAARKIFSDLKRIEADGPVPRKGKLAFFAPYMRSNGKTPGNVIEDHKQTTTNKARVKTTSIPLNSDIWYTSSEDEGRGAPKPLIGSGASERETFQQKSLDLGAFEYNLPTASPHTQTPQSTQHNLKSEVLQSSLQDGIDNKECTVSAGAPLAGPINDGQNSSMISPLPHTKEPIPRTNSRTDPIAAGTCQKICCISTREEVIAMKEEIKILKKEMEELKMFVRDSVVMTQERQWR
jgi:hypothetical protein